MDEGRSETVRTAALRHATSGRVFEASSHPMAICLAWDELGEVPAEQFEEGFVTSAGRFVDREEALGLALDAGQIAARAAAAISARALVRQGILHSAHTEADGWVPMPAARGAGAAGPGAGATGGPDR